MALPSALNAQPRSATSLAASSVPYSDWFLERQAIPELLLDEVADHALRLGAENVERRVGRVFVGGFLERKQSDLRTIAV
jgi:hypothetical protein